MILPWLRSPLGEQGRPRWGLLTTPSVRLRSGRKWEAPVLSVLAIGATEGTQQAGADDPSVASFTLGNTAPSN
jgi:hypothetical protein